MNPPRLQWITFKEIQKSGDFITIFIFCKQLPDSDTFIHCFTIKIAWNKSLGILALHTSLSQRSTLPERIYQQDLYHLRANPFSYFQTYLIPLLYFLSAANCWGTSADASEQREGKREGRLARSTVCHKWIYGWGDSSGRQSNWWVTHNQRPYHSPAKLDCIQSLVVRPDLANVSHSSPEPRQLCVISAWPGLPFPACDY